MKGTVVSIWLNTIDKIYGQDTRRRAMASVGWSESRIISPVEDINDQEIFTLVANVGKFTNTDYHKVWRTIGQNNVNEFSQWFPSYFERSTLKSFLMMMDKVHAQLTKMIKGATPPRLIPEEIDERSFYITYISGRGLTDYLMGLMEGGGKYFNETIEFEIVEEGTTSDGKKMTKFKITTEKATSTAHRYTLSTLLSLGFITHIPTKVALLPTVAVFAATLVTTHMNWVAAGINTILVYGLTVLASKSVNIPFKDVNVEVGKMTNLNFEENYNVITNDRYEATFDNINKLRERIKEDFVFVKGGIDDIHNFNKKFSEIAQKMNGVSDVISSNVKEVAEGATHQATETESSVNVLSENMQILKALSTEELLRKDQLEEAITDITASFHDLQSAASRLGDIKESFAEANKQGQALSKKVNDIISIVGTVESIAEQTNLLALNASIEAARAGEMGRGFSVVAEEIRTLAENSKSAVNTINANLRQFIGEVNSMTDRVSNQFAQLEESNTTLNQVSDQNQAATNKISGVADSIVELSDKLADETNKISSVFENMHTLAAIAEENSASAQEMSANVMEFTDQIKDFTEYIGDLEKLSVNLRNELKKYKL